GADPRGRGVVRALLARRRRRLRAHLPPRAPHPRIRPGRERGAAHHHGHGLGLGRERGHRLGREQRRVPGRRADRDRGPRHSAHHDLRSRARAPPGRARPGAANDERRNGAEGKARRARAATWVAGRADSPGRSRIVRRRIPLGGASVGYGGPPGGGQRPDLDSGLGAPPTTQREFMSHVLAGVAGVLLIAVVLRDAFEAVILPQTANRSVRLARLFYIATWGPW